MVQDRAHLDRVPLPRRILGALTGGEGPIRTHGTVIRTTVFEF